MLSTKRLLSSATLVAVLFLCLWLVGGCAFSTRSPLVPSSGFGEPTDIPVGSASGERLVLRLQETVRISPNGLGILNWSLATSAPSLTELYQKYWEQYETESAVSKDFFDQIQQEYDTLLGVQVESLSRLSPTSLTSSAVEFHMTGQIPGVASYDAKNKVWHVAVGSHGGTDALDIIWNQMLTEMIFRALLMESLPGRQQLELHRQLRFELPEGVVLINRQELEGLGWHLDFGGGNHLRARLKLEDHAVTVVEDLVQTEVIPTGLMTEEESVALFDRLSKYKSFIIQYVQDQQITTPVIPKVVTIQSRPDQFSWSRSITARSPTLNIEWDHDDGLPRGSSLTLSASTSFDLGGFIGWRFLRNGHLEWFDANIRMNSGLTVNSSVGISMPIRLPRQTKDNWWEIHRDFWFWVSWLPVVVRVQAKIDASFNVGVERATTISQSAGVSINSTTGVVYEGRRWRPQQRFNTSFNRPSVRVTVGGSMTASVGPELTLGAYIYWIAGPFARLRASLDGQVFLPPNREWELKGVLQPSWGFRTSDWLREFLRMEINIEHGLPPWELFFVRGRW